MDFLINLLPDIGASIGLFGAFEGVIRFLKHRKVRKYLGATAEILQILDTIFDEHPDYKGSKAESAINTTINVAMDGKISWQDFKFVKKLVIDLYDPRQANPKRLVGHKEVKKKKVEDLISEN